MFQYYAGNFKQPLTNWNLSSDTDTIAIFGLDLERVPRRRGTSILLLQLKKYPFLRHAHYYLQCYLYLSRILSIMVCKTLFLSCSLLFPVLCIPLEFYLVWPA
jgi:hypothetical protein